MLSFTYSLADQDFRTSKSLGILNVSTGLLRELSGHPKAERITLLSNESWENTDFGERVNTVQTAGVAGSILKRIRWDQWGVYRAARQAAHPWLVLPKGFLSFLAKPPVRVAAYVHDVMFDHYDRRYPNDVPRREQVYFRRGFRAALKHASVIVTNSRFTADEVRRMAEFYGIVPPLVRHVGIGFESTGEAGSLPGARKNILLLVSKWPHKKTTMAVEFLERWWRASSHKPPVQLIGSLPDGFGMPDHPGWEHRPRVPDGEYRALRDAARVQIYTSDYEGFGMPPVEAIDAGVCPVYSGIPAVVEVTDGSGFAFENDQYDSFGNALSEAWQSDPAQILSWKKKLNERHTWARVADRFLEAISDVE